MTEHTMDSTRSESTDFGDILKQMRPGSWRAWLLASRPATLTAAVVPVAVGSAVAHALGSFRAMPALAALGGACAIQIGTNFANDVFDHEKGADTETRVGPVRAASSGLLSPRALYGGMVTAFGTATLSGLYLTKVAGWPVVAIGTASIASGIAYTGGPYPLGYNGLGDVFVMAFFGFVAVCGTTYVQTRRVPLLSVLASIPVGAIATNILVVNNVRDRHTDVGAGKRTLAVRFGKDGVLLEYGLLSVAAYALPVAIAAQRKSLWPLLPLVTAPAAASLFRRLKREEGPALNPVLGGTAKLLAGFGLLFAAGIALSR